MCSPQSALVFRTAGSKSASLGNVNSDTLLPRKLLFPFSLVGLHNSPKTITNTVKQNS